MYCVHGSAFEKINRILPGQIVIIVARGVVGCVRLFMKKSIIVAKIELRAFN